MKNYIIFAVVAAVVIAGAMMYKSNRQGAATGVVQPTQQMPIQGSVEPEMIVTNSKPITMENGLIIEDTTVGTGAEAKPGMAVTVDYVGTLMNGTKFDASKDHGNTGFTFNLGAGDVIKGWDQGVAGMKVGGVRKLTIPADLAYGNNAVGGVIPANSTLLFTVTLLAVK